MKRLQVLMMFVCGVLTATVASAQDKGRVGLVMGYPTTFAVLWHPTEAIGIRPEIFLTRNSAETTNTSGGTPLVTSSTNLLTTVGVSGMFYGAAHENLRVYVSPRAVYSRTNNTNVSPTATTKTSSDNYSVSGSVGGQYALVRHFSAFGEIGLSYTHASNPSSATSTSESNSISMRTAVGVIWYF